MTTTALTARRRKRVAILGGGLGGLAAAFELTNQPGWSDRYEVTVYQKGWRLGGKGASGRGEHGTHRGARPALLLGLLRQRLRDAPHLLRASSIAHDGALKTVDDAFKKLSSVYFIDRRKAWRRYQMHFPETSERPGRGPASPR